MENKDINKLQNQLDTQVLLTHELLGLLSQVQDYLYELSTLGAKIDNKIIAKINNALRNY
jgi:hypothetical protein